MFVSLITLLSALSLSSISAYYSVLGLMAIFSATPIPIAVMGSALEIAKIVTTVWLHYNWEQSPFRIKAYLVPAVITLMFITSLGSYGFLSKGHADQAIPSGDIQAQVSLFDEKIKTQRDNIESAKRALVQMDGSVDQVLARSTTDAGATKSAALRKSQTKERAALQKDIDDAQKQITILQEQRAPVASQLRKVVADVGPLKYIAAVIYGDKADENLLESAVRWVIMIIVAVFDPLAIVLLLAATTSIDWAKLARTKRKHDKVEEEIVAAEDAARLLAAKTASGIAIDAHTESLISEAVAKVTAQCEAEAAQLRQAECDRCQELKEVTTALTLKSEEQQAQQTKLASVMSQVDDITDNVTDLTSMIGSMEENIAASIGREEVLRADLANLVHEYDTLLEINRTLDIKLSEASSELITLDETLTRLALAKDDIETKDREIAALQSEIDRDNLQQAEIQVMLAECKDEIDSLKAALAAAELQKSLPQPVVVDVPINEEIVADLDEVVTDYEATSVTDLVIDQGEESAQDAQDAQVEALVTVELPNDYEPVEYVFDTSEAEVAEPAEVEDTTVLDLVTDELPVSEEVPVTTIKVVPRQVPDYSLGFDNTSSIPQLTSDAHNDAVEPSALPRGGNAGFGVKFPKQPLKGDRFLRIDFSPSRLYKWSGDDWMLIDKTGVDTYSYDEEYIKLIISKLSSGEFDADDLSESESEQVALYLRTHPE